MSPNVMFVCLNRNRFKSQSSDCTVHNKWPSRETYFYFFYQNFNVYQEYCSWIISSNRPYVECRQHRRMWFSVSCELLGWEATGRDLHKREKPCFIVTHMCQQPAKCFLPCLWRTRDTSTLHTEHAACVSAIFSESDHYSSLLSWQMESEMKRRKYSTSSNDSDTTDSEWNTASTTAWHL